MRRIELNQIIAAVLCGLISLLYLFTTCMTISSPVSSWVGGLLSFSGAELIGHSFLAILPVLIGIAGAVFCILMPQPVGAILSGVSAVAPLLVALCGSSYLGSYLTQQLGFSGSGVLYSIVPGYGSYLCLVLGIGAVVCCLLTFGPRTRPTSAPGVSVDEDDF